MKRSSATRPPRRAGGKDRLGVYRAKRDFATTPEPAGKVRRGKKRALSFCVQKHLASSLHYDFRLEHDGVLLSWAVPKGPSLNPRDKRLAMRTEDHPLDYGEFEGVIPEGYGAGVVMLWDRGTWHPDDPDIAKALALGELKFTLEGVKLKGGWVLVRSGGGAEERRWLLIKHRDEWSGDLDVVAAAPLSIKSFADFAEILASEPDVWQSHMPSRGGASGAMLRDLIEQAAKIKYKAARRPKRRAKPRRPRARRAAKRAVK